MCYYPLTGAISSRYARATPMRLHGTTLSLSPTDLANHLACRHLTQLDLAIAERTLKIDIHPDPHLVALRQRGEQHEAGYVQSLVAKGRSVIDLRATHDPSETLNAMRRGVDVIVQPPLAHGRFTGRADVLLRTDAPSDLGNHSYEPVDTKLARDTRAGTILQLCTYAALLAPSLGREPERFHVVTPARTEPYRTADFAAYFRFVRARLEGAVNADSPPATYPDPVSHCDVCALWSGCNARRRADDHLSLVAGISTLNTRELQRQDITTVARLAATNGLLPAKPARGAPETYVRLAHQARLQVDARGMAIPPFDLLDPDADRGLARLPEPSAGDVFLDFEGDAFVAEGGLEYLTGWAFRDGDEWTYDHRWALTRAAERTACETFLDFVGARLERDPGLHIYHFGAYEPATLKRLASRHGTRGELLDRLLRGGRFVDLHTVVREAARIGIERYGLKELEPLIGFARTLDLRAAASARLVLELALEMGDAAGVDDAIREQVRAYNHEDCRSTAALRDWLEARRAERVGAGIAIARPVHSDGAASENVKKRDRRIQEVADALRAGVPDDPAARSDLEQARALLADMLGYFRREERCDYWEHFRLRELPPDEQVDEREMVTGLVFVEEVPRKGKSKLPVHRYRFPAQETAIEKGKSILATAADDVEVNKTFATVEAIDLAEGTIDLKKTKRTIDIHPSAVFRHQVVPVGQLEDALLEFGRRVASGGVAGDGIFGAAAGLLCRRPPRRRADTGKALRRPGETLLAAAVRLCGELDGGVLPIQGPPGSGKTYAGARAIVALAGTKRIGVTAVSHKVIDNLLLEIDAAAKEANVGVRLVHKTDDDCVPDGIEGIDDNEDALAAIGPGVVVGGTAWLWAREDAEGKLDYLFVDEAGQMALAQVLAASRAARNVVLLGDPQQLEQPCQGAHPEGTDVAALVHVLGKDATVGDAQGLFLDRTWRLHPELCRFTSETYYDRRLLPVDGLERQAVSGPTPFAGSGPCLVEATHEGNQASAPEEVDAVERIVRCLLQAGVRWTAATGKPRTLRPDDLLVVAPYNAQVAALRRRLGAHGVSRVGTVDKFQGQEAAVVVYSCTSSSAADAPRGFEFLYDPHRFNVATSRARGVAIVVASPRLFEAECRTPEQMRMVNGFCRFREMARPVTV
jgi:uncharacterized protein